MKKRINLNEIKSAPWNPRGEVAPDGVRDLAKSIEETGLINAVSLWESSDGEIYCIAGNRRLAALRSLGRETLDEDEFMLLKGIDESGARAVTVVENLQRESVGVIEEAALVGTLLDGGMTVCSVAAQLGRTESWVNRRRKLLSLSDEWKARAAGMTADALERIAEYSEDVQERVAKKASPDARTWREVSFLFAREDRDLDRAAFDTGMCTHCFQRTGQNTDLFGAVDEGCLGKCLCAKCYDKNVKAHIDELVAEATKGADEVVRLKYAWEIPRGEGSGETRTRECPCAYVWADPDTGAVTVRWGESRRAEEARRAEERKRKEAESAEKQAKIARIEAITEKLDICFDGAKDRRDGAKDRRMMDDIVVELLSILSPDIPEATKRHVIEELVDHICSWHDNEDWAGICRAFAFVPRVAGLDDAELAELLEAYPAGGGEDAR